MVIEELVKTVLSELRKISRTESVVGEPIDVGNITIIPVSRISFGFAVGGGQKDSKNRRGEGTGGGATVEPLAFFVIRGEKVDLVTIKKESIGLGKVIDLVPQILEKVKGFKSAKESSSKKQRKKKE